MTVYLAPDILKVRILFAQQQYLFLNRNGVCVFTPMIKKKAFLIKKYSDM